MRGRLRAHARLIECVLLFAGVPLLLTLWRADPLTPAAWLGLGEDRAEWLSRVAVSATFFAAAGGVLLALLLDRSFDNSRLWRFARVPPTNADRPKQRAGRELVRILSIWLVACVAIALFVRAAHPEWFLLLPRERPTRWVLIALLYPVFSVLPQGLIYRSFFLHRYRCVLGRATPIAAAIAFGAMHAVFLNWMAPLLCLAGGALFTWTYVRTGSAVLAWLEHSLHGVAAFSLGLGLYFFLGAPRDAAGRIVPPGSPDAVQTAPAPTVGAALTLQQEPRP